MKKATAILWLLVLGVAAFSLATTLQLRVGRWGKRGQADNVLKVLLGDGRRLFANHFFVQADIYFHSGYYPSIFDRRAAPKDSRHMTAKEEDHKGHQHEREPSEHEKEMNFLGPPRDWIEKFGRRFQITEHTHLEGGREREMLPWLRLSAELDPQRIDTYTVAAYWLRNLGKVKEAEDFLREGWRNNPDSYEILLELGRLYFQNYRDTHRARNVWELALRKWNAHAAAQPKDLDLLTFEQIALNLENLEEAAGNLERALQLLELARRASPNPAALQKRIDELNARLPRPSPVK